MQEPSIGMVVLLGIGIVFIGLICLVALLAIMNAIFSKVKVESKPAATPVAAAPTPSSDEKPDEQTVAAISAAVAEALGKGVEAIRITSIKKVN